VVGSVPEPPSPGVLRPSSWGRLGLEVVTDVIGWLAAIAILELIGTTALDRIARNTVVGVVVIVVIVFFAVTVIVRVGFMLLPRRTTR
jgi:hypothetical protein